MDGGLRDRGVGRDDRAASAAHCADDRTGAGGGGHVVDFAVFAVSALAGWGPLGNCSRTVDGGVVSAAWPNVTNTGQQPRAEKHEFVTSWSAASVDRTVRWLRTTASTINDLVDNRGSFPLFAELLFSARTTINQRRTLQMAAVGSGFIAFRARPLAPASVSPLLHPAADAPDLPQHCRAYRGQRAEPNAASWD